MVATRDQSCNGRRSDVPVGEVWKDEKGCPKWVDRCGVG